VAMMGELVAMMSSIGSYDLDENGVSKLELGLQLHQNGVSKFEMGLQLLTSQICSSQLPVRYA
jgi:hypothetical protein